MTRDEIRGLIGGYSTGSLTDAERKMLFEAALEDQDLFDDLAREQALKEALDAPGAKRRLISALTAASKPWWKAPWVWALAGAAIAVAITGIFLLRPAPKQELARVELPAPPAVPFVPPAPPVVPPAPAIPLPKTEAKPTPAPIQTVSPKQEATPELEKVARAQAPAPPPAPQSVGQLGPVPSPDVALGFAVNGIPTAPLTAGAVGGGGGGRGGGRGGAAPANRAVQQFAADATREVRFAFDYSVTPEGVLRVTPAINGFLSVSVNSPTAMPVLFANRPLQNGVATEVQLPMDASSVMVVFSLREAPADSLKFSGPANDPLSGTKADPNLSPNSRLIAVIPLPR